MKVLVSGGLGFIGSNLVDALINEGHEVYVVDDMSTGKLDYKNKSPKAQYWYSSITNKTLMLELTAEVEAIFHVAAWARLMRSIDDPLGTNENNITGTLTLLECARHNNVPRFIFSSSSSVYGQQVSPEMQESMLPYPLHPYALQKWCGEKYCQMYSRLFGLQTICLRYFNVYGKRQVIQGDYALVIGKFLRQKSEGKPMTIYGDGEQTRAYTHVSDVVNANILAYKRKMEPGQNIILNIGTSEETSVNKITEMLGGEVEHIIPNPRGNFEERRKAANFSLAKQILGWEPKITIGEGIKRLIAKQ